MSLSTGHMGDSIMKKVFTLLGFIILGLSLMGCKERFEVSFDTDGGTRIESIRVDGNSTVDRPDDPERYGHTFIGWYDHSLVIPFDFDRIISTEITIYAKWEVNLYSITYVDHEGNPLIIITLPYGSSVGISAIAVPERIGYQSSGWSQTLPATMPAMDIIIAPTYTPNIYTLALLSLEEEPEFLSVNFGEVITLPVLSDDHMTFLGWTENEVDVITTYTHSVTRNHGLSAVWSYELDDVTYWLINDRAYLKSYGGNAIDLTIPDQVLDLDVLMVLEGAFKDNHTLESLKLGKHVLYVDDYAFSNMTSLKTIEMMDATKDFGDYVFYGSNALEMMTVSSGIHLSLVELFGGLTFDIPSTLSDIKFASGGLGYSSYFMRMLPDLNITIELGSSLTSIESTMFFESRVNHLVIPKSVTFIDHYGLNGLLYLKTVTFEEGSALEAIGEYAFSSTALITIELPEKVSFIDPTTFRYVNLLENIDVHEDNTHFTSVDGVLYSKDMKVLYRYPSSKVSESFTIPDSVETIESYAFSSAYTIESIQCSESSQLKVINDYVFVGMNNLESLELPEGLLSIGMYLYGDQSRLPHVIIPESVVSMKANAFPSYMLVKHVIYMKGLVPGDLFEEGWDNTRFTIVFGYQEEVMHEGILYAKTTDGRAILVDAAGSRPATSIIIPEMIGTHQVTEIGSFAFLYHVELISIELPTSIEFIHTQAFAECKSLEEINIRSLIHLKSVGSYSFCSTSLVDVVLPDGLEKIGQHAFCDNDDLLSLYIPESVLFVEGGIVMGSDLVVIRLERGLVPETWFGFWNYTNRPVVFNYVLTE